jgi:hypothetical protein
MSNDLILEEKIDVGTMSLGSERQQVDIDQILKEALPKRVFEAEIDYNDANNRITIHGLNRSCNGKSDTSGSCRGDSPCPCSEKTPSPLEALGLSFQTTTNQSATQTSEPSSISFSSKIENQTVDHHTEYKFTTYVKISDNCQNNDENDLPEQQKLRLVADWKSDYTEIVEPWFGDHKETLIKLLSRDACSKTTMKKSGQLAISYAFSGAIGENDPYPIVAKTVDQAIRHLVAEGIDPTSIAMDANLIWANPIYDAEKNANGKFRAAQLVRAMMGVYETAQDLGITSPFDLNRNPEAVEFYDQEDQSGQSIITVTAIGVNKAQNEGNRQPKQLTPGDRIYVLGTTWPELGGSEWASLSGQTGKVPEVDPYLGRLLYQAFYKASSAGYVKAVEVCAEGGLAVAFAKMGVNQKVGLTVDLCRVPYQQCEQNGEVLYSETPSRFVVAVAPAHAGKFEVLFDGLPCDPVGEVIADANLMIRGIRGRAIIEATLPELGSSRNS